MGCAGQGGESWDYSLSFSCSTKILGPLFHLCTASWPPVPGLLQKPSCSPLHSPQWQECISYLCWPRVLSSSPTQCPLHNNLCPGFGVAYINYLPQLCEPTVSPTSRPQTSTDSGLLGTVPHSSRRNLVFSLRYSWSWLLAKMET